MIVRGVLLGGVWALLGVLSAPAAAAVPAWTTYRHDGARSGVDPDSTSPVAPAQAWQSVGLDGTVWAQPLVYGTRVYAVTENDTVYALDAATGSIVWQRHLATPVSESVIPCQGDINPTVGITSTPLIDPATGRIYVIADTWDASNASSVAHAMYGLNLSDGSVGVGPVPVDPPGSVHTDQLQRASLALDAGKLIIGYGGNDGDCGNYHGWLVAVREDGTGSLQSFEVDGQPGDSEGAIWGSGNAPAIDSVGNVWISTGNGDESGSNSFDFSESVIKLDPNMNLLDWWAPASWQTLDNNDADIGSSMPVLLPGGLVFEIGKQGIGYLLNASNLGHKVGSPVYSRSVCSGSWGGGIYVNGVIYVTCSDGVQALALVTTTNPPSFHPLPGWTVNGGAVGPPAFAGGLVWSVGTSVGGSSGLLYGLDPGTGATTFSTDLGGYEHFTTPSAAGGRLFVANQDQSVSGADQITALQIANTAPPSPTSVALTSSANPVAPGQPITLSATVAPAPDAGTVAFTDGGAPIAGCSAVAVGPGRNVARCTAAFARAGAHSIRAVYSGDGYYLASSGSLSETVGSTPSGSTAAPKITGLAVRVVHRKLRLKLTLSQAARLVVVISKLEPARVVGGRCRPGATHGRRCNARRRRGTLHLFARAGQRRLAPHMRALLPGRYAITLTAVGSNGKRSRAKTVIIAVGQVTTAHAAARIALQMAVLGLSLV